MVRLTMPLSANLVSSARVMTFVWSGAMSGSSFIRHEPYASPLALLPAACDGLSAACSTGHFFDLSQSFWAAISLTCHGDIDFRQGDTPKGFMAERGINVRLPDYCEQMKRLRQLSTSARLDSQFAGCG